METVTALEMVGYLTWWVLVVAGGVIVWAGASSAVRIGKGPYGGILKMTLRGIARCIPAVVMAFVIAAGPGMIYNLTVPTTEVSYAELFKPLWVVSLGCAVVQLLASLIKWVEQKDVERRVGKHERLGH